VAGELVLPASTVREPFIDADDIADVVVAALTDDRHKNRLYEVTGPRALTFAEAVAEISAISSRPIRYTIITPQEFVAGLHAAGLPADIVALLDELFTVVLDGRNEEITRGVTEALGRPATDFVDFARKAAESGVWSSKGRDSLTEALT
jgi:uncharacterized protein YbjT (DUF2867 family)